MSNGTTGWTVSNFNAPVGGNGNNSNKGVDDIKYGWQSNPTNSVNVSGAASESYAGWNDVTTSSYSMKQSVTLPEGSYRLVCYAFYREGQAYNTDANTSRARLFAGTKAETNIKTLGSITAGSYANSQQAGAICFDTKMYRNEIEFTVGAGGETFDIGVDGTFSVAKSWCILGMFELFDMNDLASVSSPTDMTYAIKNPGFEYRSLEGWTNGSGDTYALTNTEAFGNRAGIYWVEKWTGGSGLDDQSDFKQTLSNMPAGLYELSVYAHNVEQYNSDAAGTGMYVIANSNQTEIGAAGQYKVRTTLAEDGDLTVGIKLNNCSGNWIAFDRFELKFFGDPLQAYKDELTTAVTAAQTLINGAAGSAISATAKAAWQAVVDDNDNDGNAFTEESQFTTAIANIEAANTNYQAMAVPYATWLKVKAGADAMTKVANNNASATSTLTEAVSNQDIAAEAAITPAALNTAISTLRTDIRTFISDTEPTGGARFEITCLVENPSFDNNTIDGWTRTVSGGGNAQTSFTCNEFWNNTFDFYQDLTDLPNGSYQLSVQAFSRPGGNDVAYPAYVGGTNSVTAELYVNNDASTVGNIYAYTGNTTGAKVTSGSFVDYKCEVEGGTDYWVPNGMEGAHLYFENEDVYKTTVAALVEDGNLRIGFRDETLTASQWTIFDNFRLFYYGSDKSVYYAQYLPQLIAEVEADKSNALYANVTGKELSDLNTALAVDASGFTTEQQYSDAIQAIKDAQTAYRAAYPAYDAFVAAQALPTLTEITANIGTGVFQYPASTPDKWTTYSSAKTAVDYYTVDATSTAADIQTLVDDLDAAIADYNGITLNAPAAGTRYNLIVATDGHAKNGNAVIIVPGTSGNNNPTGYGLNANFAPNANLAQAVTFTQVSGNNYNISFETTDGTTYLTYGTTNGSAADWADSQIQATTDASKKGEFKIAATSTANVFNIYNTITNSTIACQNGGNIYTEAGNADFSVAEASQATVNVTIATDVKYGTRIFPFSPSLSDVTFYSCEASDGDVLTLTTVGSPVADTPYILYAENGLASTDLEGWGVAGALTKTAGWLTGVYTATEAPVGSYVLQNNNSKVGFYQVATGEQPTVGTYRCYLTEPTSSRGAYFFAGTDETTGIDAINALTSGKAEIYNATGVRVPALQKGMNIIRTENGTKKVMVK